MKPKYKYKTQSEVTPLDRKQYLIIQNGNILESISLEKSKEVAKGLLSQNVKRQEYIKQFGEYSSSDLPQNWKSARKSKDGTRYLDKGIQLYRLWFNFLKLALELESKNVTLVREKETLIKNWNNKDIPPEVIQKSRNVTGGSQSAGLGGTSAIFRCKLIQKVKVKKSAYKGWDLDEVLERPFGKWWETHGELFGGMYPSVMQTKGDWDNRDNYFHLKIDRNMHWLDVLDYMKSEIRGQFKEKVKPKFSISGKNPRVNVIQNNFNALVLRLKGWTHEEICTSEKIYLRTTDDVEHLEGSSRKTTDGRLKVFIVNKKPLYARTVSPQINMGLHHLFEVCEGRFGTVLDTK